MPFPSIHSVSTAVAGFVIAAYWVVFFITVASRGGVEQTIERASLRDELAVQVCEMPRDLDVVVNGERDACGSNRHADETVVQPVT
jgi:hypothetical protein